MGMKVKTNAVNQAEKGTVIYAAGEQVNSVCIILKGRALAMNSGSKILMGSGCFLGVHDVYSGHYVNSYIAYDDITFYCFPVVKKDDVEDLFAINKDYKGLLVASLIKFTNEAEKIYTGLQQSVQQLYDFVIANHEKYLETGKRLGYPVKSIDMIQEAESYISRFEIDERKLMYYKECGQISHEVWKTFCAGSDYVALYLIEEISELIGQVLEECTEMAKYITVLFDSLMNNSEACLFKNIAALAITIEEAGGYNNDLMRILDDIVDEINVIERLFNDKVGSTLTVDRNRMEEIYYTLLSQEGNRKEQAKDQFQYTQSELQQMDQDFNQSLKQILKYANFEEERAASFEKYINDFINLKNKHSTDDSPRLLRRRIAEHFYDLYELVFLKAYQDNEVPKVIDLFLKYGFLDERLLSQEQLKELYNLQDDSDEKSGPCHVYNIKDWLIHIYEGDKEPSKNDFDMDYKDMLRDKRRKAEITEEEEKVLLNDMPKKLSYEIHNMFRSTHRLVNGQISTFVPFMFSENLIHNISKLFVTRERINTAIKELLEIDYSVFHRESMYVNNEKGIVKEYIMQQVFPDIVLFPTVGYNGIMWQEITGKKKNSEGRFFLPIFTDASIKDMLIKVFGRFRWELCRSIQGTAWNNIKYKSLTSEYSDYIQFYRKNHDLSEETKEKIKQQIQKGKGNYREIFVIDYEAWIKGEASGSLRLNKLVREMLATYCPFSKPIRERLVKQPLFAEAMIRFQRNTMKKLREIDGRCRALEKENIELTEEIMETVIFYRDL